jgi:hypothetical protein
MTSFDSLLHAIQAASTHKAAQTDECIDFIHYLLLIQILLPTGYLLEQGK